MNETAYGVAMFAKEYLVDLNATQAAKRAGYTGKNVGAHGHELMKVPEIRTLIAKGLEQ